MAKSSEIIQIEQVTKALSECDTELNKLQKSYLTLIKTTSESVTGMKDIAINLEAVSKAQKDVADNTKKANSINKEYETALARLNKLTSEEGKALLDVRAKIAQVTQAQKDKRKADEAEEGSLVRMRLRLKELTTEYDKAGVRTKAMTNEINNLSKEIGKAEEATNRGQRSVGQYGKIWEGIKGMLPIASVAAIGGAVVGAFNAIKNSTDATADAFSFAIKGMTNGLDFFWKTLATGDWSNFMKGMTDAITTGYQYAEMLDKIEDQTRSLSIMEADMVQENIELEIQLRNRNLTPEQRKALGEKRLENEAKLVAERTRIANQGYNAEVLIASQQTKLSEDQLMTVARDINSQKKLDAEEYKSKVEQLEKMRSLNVRTQGTGYGSVAIQQADTPEIKALEATIKATDKGVVEYASLFDSFNILTAESKDKFVKSLL